MYKVGIEREGLRCDRNGALSKHPHLDVFGDKIKNRFVTTDFGECQLEIRTNPYESVDECYEKLFELTNSVLCELYDPNETLWYYSFPCKLPGETAFLFNDYSKYPIEKEYEHYLAEKYGREMHQISGIHINFSIEKDTFDRLRNHYKHIPCDYNEAYMNLVRNFLKKQWFAVCFLGATPINESNNTAAFSLKNLPGGFKNLPDIQVDYKDLCHYLKSIRNLIDSGEIFRYSEAYLPIRIRGKKCSDELSDIERNGINYLEVRLGEINPFDICGISRKQISLMIAFLFSCLVDTDPWEVNLKDISYGGTTEEIKSHIEIEFEKCIEICKKLGLGLESDINSIFSDYKNENLVANRIKNEFQGDFFSAVLNQSITHSEDARKRIHSIQKYPELESATAAIIRDGLVRGIDYRIIDEKRSIVEFSDGENSEIIVQATKTKKDSYIFPYITDDKVLVKERLLKSGISVPKGVYFSKKDYQKYGEDILKKILGKPFVVKPKSANYGEGIRIVSDYNNKEIIDNAINEAFKYDGEVIAEEYIEGKEYRFFLIDGKCESVVWRRCASVVGDGLHNVKELVSIVEETPRYKYCDKIIPINESVDSNLKEIGMSLDSIPDKGKRVFLQKVTNATLGGESVDCTDTMPNRFKEVAEKAANLFKAFICGVDIIIPDISEDYYKVLEINDNPGLLISEAPYEGKGKRLGIKIFESIGLDIG